MERQVEVSVIIPVYNVELYLKECLDTVVHQTLKCIEIIIVDDGSTDGSRKIIKEYMQLYKNIKLIIQDNHGQGYAKNRALEIASGEYVYFMDSDDKIELYALELLYSSAINEKLDMVLFDADVFCEEKELFGITQKFHYISKFEYKEKFSGVQGLKMMLDNGDYKTSLCMRLIKRSILEKNNIRFPEYIIHEDEWFGFKSYLKSKKIKHIPEVLFHRRIRSNSTMTSKTYEKSFLGYYKTILLVFDEYSKNYAEDSKTVMQKYISIIFFSICNNYIHLEKKKREMYKQDWEKISIKMEKEKMLTNKKMKLMAKHIELYAILKKVRDEMQKFLMKGLN